MRCLWLTRIDPSAEDTGELIYSAQLIRAFARAGADITVLCFPRPGAPPPPRRQTDGIRWQTVPGETLPAWRSVFSGLPNLACRCAVPAFRRQLRAALDNGRWDAVVVDSLTTGWALADFLASDGPIRGRRPRLVYVSHNHEETTRGRVAADIGGSPLKRAALRADARKAARLERKLVRAADLVTAISPADCTLYADTDGAPQVIELTPGYGGRRVAARDITSDTPRRVVMVGSFEWGAKKANLGEFARAAVPALDRAGIELSVVGNGGRFVETLRREYPSVHFTGRVENVYEHMDRARIAVVPERLGGGFKLKALDYVFNRLPIAALENACAGMPLTNRDSVLSFADLDELADGLVAAIDDLPTLNRLQRKAFANCSGRFDWDSRGKALHSALAAL